MLSGTKFALSTFGTCQGSSHTRPVQPASRVSVGQRRVREREILCVARIGSLAACRFVPAFLLHSSTQPSLFAPFPPLPFLPSYSFLLTSPHPSTTIHHHLTANSPLLPFPPPLCLSFYFVSFVVTLTLSQTSELFSYCIASSSVKRFLSFFYSHSISSHFTPLHLLSFSLFFLLLSLPPCPQTAISPDTDLHCFRVIVCLLGNRQHTYYPLHSRGSLKPAIKYST